MPRKKLGRKSFKIQVVLPAHWEGRLAEMEARARLVSRSEVVRKALERFEWILEQMDMGREIISRPVSPNELPLLHHDPKARSL